MNPRRGWLLLALLCGCEPLSIDFPATLIADRPPDEDGDGVPATEDCDDDTRWVHPGSDERCDGVDADCDGFIDEHAVDAPAWYLDADGDGFGRDVGAVYQCRPPIGHVRVGGDCDDDDAARRPGVPELCDGLDNDCDGLIDDDDVGDLDPSSTRLLYRDRDGDGYGDATSPIYGCGPENTSLGAGDCDDYAYRVNPGEAEVCDDGIDNDCDGVALQDCVGAEANIGELSDRRLDGVQIQGFSGFAVAGGGDLTGDGAPDLVISAMEDTEAALQAGVVYLVSDLPPIEPGAERSHRLTEVGLSIQGGRAEDHFGYTLALPGDVNRDGFDDLLIGVPGPLQTEDRPGNASLFLGPLTEGGSAGEAHVRMIGEADADKAGFAVAGVGDVDGDGLPDMLVGAPHNAAAGAGAGAAYLVLGAPLIPQEYFLEDADARIRGNGEADAAGSTLAGAGDVNGDGFADLLIGAPNDALAAAHAGVTYLFEGPIRGTLAVSEAAALFIGESESDRSGASVAGCGDVNGDGYDDFLIGAPNDSTTALESGAAYLVFGPVVGIRDLDGAPVKMVGEARVRNHAGHAVAGPGDVDGDGRPDLLVGAPGDPPENRQRDRGNAYLILRPESGTVRLDAADLRIQGERFGDFFGGSVGGAGDLDQDGRADLMVGAIGRDAPTGVEGVGATYVIFSEGLFP